MELKPLGLALAVITLPLAVSAAPAIEVFTTDEFPITLPAGMQVTVANLDSAGKYEQELGSDLGTEPTKAKALVMARLNTPRGRFLIEAIPKSYEHSARAMKLGLKSLPAVVVDDRFVVYGLTDVGQAVARIEQLKQQQGATQ